MNTNYCKVRITSKDRDLGGEVTEQTGREREEHRPGEGGE